ncbi:MAG: aldo/keto reductase [Anaerolineaceae bacterium]|nr:aldo/keto reductase [Anaerolineaceae bacterium]
MQYTHLGRTGLLVSRFCLGTANLGPFTAPEDSPAIMNEALELGINFFDTADIYGWWGGREQPGLSEEIIGRWLAEDQSRRRQIVLAGKVYFPMSDDVNDRGLSAYHIRQACEDSLRRLKTDHIDLYQMHHVDRGQPQPTEYEWGMAKPGIDRQRSGQRKPETSWEEIWQAMELLVQQGKVLYLGSSNFAGWNIAQACERARQRNFLGLVSDQSLYNLSQRSIEMEVIPACREYGLGLLPYMALAGGLLAGTLRKAAAGRRTPLYDELAPGMKLKIDAWEAFCRDLGEAPAHVATAWLLKNPAVTAPIIGPRRVEHLADSLRSLDLDLDEATMARLDEIWPGPGGQAPEAYAW